MGLRYEKMRTTWHSYSVSHPGQQNLQQFSWISRGTYTTIKLFTPLMDSIQKIMFEIWFRSECLIRDLFPQHLRIRCACKERKRIKYIVYLTIIVMNLKIWQIASISTEENDCTHKTISWVSCLWMKGKQNKVWFGYLSDLFSIPVQYETWKTNSYQVSVSIVSVCSKRIRWRIKTEYIIASTNVDCNMDL